MPSVSVGVDGVERFASTLADAADGLADLAPKAAGDIAAEEATLKAPRRSKRLAASVRAVVARALVSVTADASYAAPVHNGWIQGGRAHRGQPFILAAIATTEERVTAAYEHDAQAVLDNVKGA